MKFILNGELVENSTLVFGKNNPIFNSGDLVYETLKIANQTIVLAEEHYFNLMASMRIFRMNIPMNFTQEFFESELERLLKENSISNAKAKISVFRDSSDDLCNAPVSYLIEILEVLPDANYGLNTDFKEIDVYKDFAVNTSFFSQLNLFKPEEIVAQAYRQENDLADLVLLNHEKRIARSLYGSLFLVQGNVVKTPKISEGGLRSVTRNYLIKSLKRNPNFLFEETEIFPFELQKSDELFVCVEGEGLRSIHKNRKKEYQTLQTERIVEWMNEFLLD